jgi:hypothetical protein
MCRSIKTLRVAATPASIEEVNAAALQFVRKISGYRKPSQAHALAFNTVVEEIALSAQKLLDSLVPTRQPKA